uniref:Uncharacterized protein n=1 Tax=Panagrolaimus sp. PS1159 TaxID=55785 RepID=A0AC35G954_9BILA
MSNGSLTNNLAFLFLQIHCALYEQHSQVQIDGWVVDNGYKTCMNINSDNPTENIIQAASFSSPQEHPRTLCEILEVAKKCANQYNKNTTEKLHIVVGILLHDEIGNCKIEEMFTSVNFHLTIFWVREHRKPASVHSEIVDSAILESLTDISPKEGWFMPEVSLKHIQEAKEVGNGNPIFDSLYPRLKRISDNAIAGFSDTTVTLTVSVTKEETTVAPNIISSTESFNATVIFNATKNAVEEELSFLEEIGEVFGDKDHGILYLLLIILLGLLILCGISILTYCLWPKTDHSEVHSKTKPSNGNTDTDFFI